MLTNNSAKLKMQRPMGEKHFLTILVEYLYMTVFQINISRTDDCKPHA